MKRIFSLLISFLMLGSLISFAQMSDEQVVNYVKSGLSTGKGEKQIATELLARGVTAAQIERLRSAYESGKGAETVTPSSGASSSSIRNSASTDSEVAGELDAVSADITNPVNHVRTNQAEIFGHSIFNGRALSFEPNMNIATPETYILGPGDEVIIDIWGENEASIRQTISPEGRIMVSQIGPIYLNGLSIKQANNLVKRTFSQKYAGVSGERAASEVSVTLGQIRTIQVNVFGEVSVPGTYRLSAFSTVFNALYMAGGVTEVGTLRDIQVIRNGKKIADIDVYPYLFSGSSADFRLQDGDVIIVPLYGILAGISGNVKKPMHYELKEGQTLADLIEYAGGFESDAFRGEVKVVRETGREREIKVVSDKDFASFKMDAGDAVTVGSMIDRFSNRVEIQGSVFRPGMYEIGGDVTTVRQLVDKAEGLMEDAFTSRVRLLRQMDDFTPEVISIDLGALMAGRAADIKLKKNDVLVIPSIHELKDLGELTIRGYVARPGTFVFAENTTIEDLILQAGGLLDGASTVRVDVSRRINNPESYMPTDQLAEEFSFPLDPSLKVASGADTFILMPYDEVTVRKSPGYSVQANVEIQGEVAFPGAYTLLSNSERISELVARSGGVTNNSYLKGGILIRKMTSEEYALRNATNRMINRATIGDDISADLIDNSLTYTVAIELDKALAQPGSVYDVVLQEGDVLVIPQYLSTVKIGGDVMYPNTVVYKPGARVGYYINQAGGYGNNAKKSRAYVVYMNGNVSKARMWTRIEPGCEIIIPSKPEKTNRMSTTEVLSLSTSAASMASVVATLVRLFIP